MRYSSLAVLVACSLAASASHAAIGTIIFKGEVTDQTCQATINGHTNAAVMLPTVSQKELDKKVGDTTGDTSFTVSITECTKPSTNGAQKVFLRLNGEHLTNDGHLANIATSNAATGVAIQLADGEKKKIELRGETRTEVGTLTPDDTVLEKEFIARYVREAGEIKNGQVTAIVRYDLSYQ